MACAEANSKDKQQCSPGQDNGGNLASFKLYPCVTLSVRACTMNGTNYSRLIFM